MSTTTSRRQAMCHTDSRPARRLGTACVRAVPAVLCPRPGSRARAVRRCTPGNRLRRTRRSWRPSSSVSPACRSHSASSYVGSRHPSHRRQPESRRDGRLVAGGSADRRRRTRRLDHGAPPARETPRPAGTTIAHLEARREAGGPTGAPRAGAAAALGSAGDAMMSHVMGWRSRAGPRGLEAARPPPEGHAQPLRVQRPGLAGRTSP